MNVQVVIADVTYPRVTITKERITLKNSKWDDALVEEISNAAFAEYTAYMANGYDKTIRGRYRGNGSIGWDRKNYPKYKIGGK
jgi:hypothetical protein